MNQLSRQGMLCLTKISSMTAKKMKQLHLPIVNALFGVKNEKFYICAMELYLLSILAHAYGIIIDCGFFVPVHGKYVVDGLNATEKWFISMLMENVQLRGYRGYANQTAMHITTQKNSLV